MHRFANPARFARFAAAATPWSAAATVLLFAIGLWLALVASPPDCQQGESVRIMDWPCISHSSPPLVGKASSGVP